MELRHFLEKTFVASQCRHPPARLTLLCMWGSLDACVGCGLEDRQGSKPRGNASAQGIHFHPCMRATPPTSHPSISYRPDEFTVSCISVWQQQPSCVWRLQQAAVCWHPGGFSFFAVDLGLALHTLRGPANVRHGAPHRRESTALYQGGIISAVEAQDVKSELGLRLLFQSFKV